MLQRYPASDQRRATIRETDDAPRAPISIDTVHIHRELGRGFGVVCVGEVAPDSDRDELSKHLERNETMGVSVSNQIGALDRRQLNVLTEIGFRGGRETKLAVKEGSSWQFVKPYLPST
jgi:hypothetical protein